MSQTKEEMHQKIMKASNKKILRRQLELLAEYSRTIGTDRIPESSEAMVSIQKELIRNKRNFIMLLFIAGMGANCYLKVKELQIKKMKKMTKSGHSIRR